MKIPTYVKELMERSRYEFDFCKSHKDYSAGYTITIRKRSAYAHVDTLRKEVERLCKYCRDFGIPNENYFCMFNAATRREAAAQLEEGYREQIEFEAKEG